IGKFDQHVPGLNARNRGRTVIASQACNKNSRQIRILDFGYCGGNEPHRVLDRFFKRSTSNFGLLELSGFLHALCFVGLLGSAIPAGSHRLSADGDAGTDEEKEQKYSQESDEFPMKQVLYKRLVLNERRRPLAQRISGGRCCVKRTVWIQRARVRPRSRRIESLRVSQVFHRGSCRSAAVLAKAILTQNLCAT